MVSLSPRVSSENNNSSESAANASPPTSSSKRPLTLETSKTCSSSFPSSSSSSDDTILNQDLPSSTSTPTTISNCNNNSMYIVPNDNTDENNLTSSSLPEPSQDGLFTEKGFFHSSSSQEDHHSDHNTSTNTNKSPSLTVMDRMFRYFNYEDDKFEYRRRSIGDRLKFVYVFYLTMIGLLGYLYIDQPTQGRLVFYALVSLETLVNVFVIKLIQGNATMAKKEALNLFMTLFSCANRVVLQVYYGPSFPTWIINTYLIVITSNSLYFKKWTTLLNCILILTTTQVSLYFSYQLMEFRADEGELFSKSSERQSPILLGFQCLNKRKFIKMAEICIMQVVVTMSGFLFSDISEKQYEKIFEQQMEIMKEKVLNHSKTKFIGNLSHEVRNPLHGVVGSIQILRHEAERLNRYANSTGKKNVARARRRKNSLPTGQLDPMETFHNENGGSEAEENVIIASNQSSMELIDDIYNNSILLLNIFSRSLQLSNLELGKLKLSIQSFNFLELLESMTSVFYTLANDKQISLQSFFNFMKVPTTFKGDNVKISQVLMNIISNGIKYTKKGYVLVTCDLCSDEDFKKFNLDSKAIEEIKSKTTQGDKLEEVYFLHLQCHDSGVGISEENMKTLFKPFQTIEQVGNCPNFEQYFSKYSASQSRSKKNEIASSTFSDRNGLGLSISKSFVDAMHGKIGVQSQLNKGTTISVLLPLVKSNDITAAFSNQSINDQLQIISDLKVESLNIFIIDQNITSKKVLHDYLQMIFLNASFHQFDNSNITLDSSNSSGKVILVFYGDEMHENVQQTFRSLRKKSLRTIFIPISNRGFSNRSSSLRYLTRPLRVGDLLDVLIQSLTEMSDSDRSFLEKDDSFTLQRKFSTKKHVSIKEEKKDLTFKYALVVDDNAINRKVLTKLLKMVGFEEIDQAENGLEAFEKYKQNIDRYDVIFMDLLMPYVSGKESCEMIRNHSVKSNTLIVAVTANTWETKDMLCKSGFDSVMYKPILLESLKNELENMKSLRLPKVNNLSHAPTSFPNNNTAIESINDK
nr:unnamed protein product [Naegleria fowleri]